MSSQHRPQRPPANQLEALLDVGRQAHQVGRFADAERAYRQVLQLNPSCADAWQLLGLIAERAGQNEAAVEHIQQAIALRGDQPGYFNNLGTVYEGMGRYRDAISCFYEALRLRPSYAAAYNNIGECYKALGDVHAAVECYREALFREPYFHACRSNLLMVLNYDPTISPEQLFKEHCLYGELLRLESPPPYTSWPNTRDAARPLRIGYVSPDFRKHAVARFFEPILTHQDHAQFASYLYGEVPGIDEVCRRFQGLSQGWASSVGLDARQLAERIRADRIDILVDLAGHTRRNRLDVFALRSAPVQVTYLGYSNTTGLDTIQYRISDSVLDPLAEPPPMVEEVVRIQGSFACFMPPSELPPLSPLPMRRRGSITFGSHHPTIKFNDEVFRLWSRMLAAVPNARLLMFRNQLGGEALEWLQGNLERFAFPLDRIDLRCPSEHPQDYLRLYDEIDVVLDTIPFNSHTMTCEALWMGCPTLTLYGDRPTARLSSSVLRQLGLEQFIARSPDEFIAIGRRLALDPVPLEGIRAGVREKMRTRLGDGASFTRQLEAIYRQLWRRWVAT